PSDLSWLAVPRRAVRVRDPLRPRPSGAQAGLPGDAGDAGWILSGSPGAGDQSRTERLRRREPVDLLRSRRADRAGEVEPRDVAEAVERRGSAGQGRRRAAA